MVTICRPVVLGPDHVLEQHEFLNHVTARLKDQPGLPSIMRILRNTTVRTRRLVQPWPETSTDTRLGQRMIVYRRAGVALAARAADAALTETGVRPDQVGCLVVVSCTGHALPGIDAHLVEMLGLPPTVRRLPVMQMGCAGGAYALVRATELARAYDRATLVIAVELPSLSYQPGDTSISALVSQAIFGDACAATVVQPGDLPGLRPGPSWEYLLPGSLSDMAYRLDERGLHFDTQPSVSSCVQRISPHLRAWLRDTQGRGIGWEPQFLIAHTGGPKIMDTLRDGLGCDEALLTHSRAGLSEYGNTASVAVLDVLARTYQTPPPHTAQGLLVAFGPGVTTVALRCWWNRGPGSAQVKDQAQSVFEKIKSGV